MVVVKSKVREQIVASASKVFTRLGYRKTTMDEIARSANMGKSSMYYYYQSKEEIFEAVVVREAQELKKKLISVISTNKPPRERLKDYILFRLYNVKTMSNFHSVLKEEYLEQMKFVNRVRKKFEEEEYKMVREILETGIQDETFIITNPDVGAIAFTTMLKGLELPLFLKDYSRSEKEKLLEDLIQVIFYGIVKRSDTPSASG
jgi:AcrR family transcriptional regulator